MKKEEIEANPLLSWIDRIIEGPTGFKAWEENEWVIFHWPRECGIAHFVIRCLANPACEGSQEMLDEIMAQRKRLENK
jgi:hypothetical protein